VRRNAGGIRGRLLLLVLGVAVPLSYVGLTGLRGLWEVSRTKLDESVRKQAELAAVAFESWIDAQREPLSALAEYRTERPSPPKEFEKLLRAVVDTRAHWLGLRIVDESGTTVVVEPRDAPPLEEELSADLVSQVRARSWSVEADWGSAGDGGVLVIAAPINDRGAVIAQVDLSAISDSFFRGIESDDLTLAIIGPLGRALLYRSPTRQRQPAAGLTESPLLASLEGRQSSVVVMQSPVDGIRRVYGLARAGDTGCAVVVGVPSETLYAPALAQLDRYVAYSIIAVLLALVAAVVIARGISQPVRRLTKAARRFGTGAQPARATFSSSGEIEELRTAFNSMAAKIEEREARLLDLDRLKSDFVSGVSHEMRTPLTTIKTLTRVLLRGKVEEDERREFLETIAAECDRQIDLVLNLLDLSRIEAGTFGVAPSRVDIDEAMKACAAVEHHNAEARGHRLRVEPYGDIPAARADRAALRRVLCGLVQNAAKYTPDGGLITLSARPNGEFVGITVADNGRGILSEDLPHIFEKFYRGRQASPQPDQASDLATETAEPPGVGLGLYLAHTIVNEMGGRISVDSEIGRGSRFTVWLPMWTAGGDRHEDT
jgi:signal transduction histidine kinase